MAKNSPFPCGLDSKPVQSVGTPLGPVAYRVQTSEQTRHNFLGWKMLVFYVYAAEFNVQYCFNLTKMLTE